MERLNQTANSATDLFKRYFDNPYLRPKPNLILPRAHFLETSNPSFSSTFLKYNAFVTRLLISLRSLTMSRPSHVWFLQIIYCKYVHMYSSTVICTALPNVYTITYHKHDAIQYYLAILCFFIKKRTLQGIEPETSTLIKQVYQNFLVLVFTFFILIQHE